MKAIVYTEYGSPEVLRLEDVDRPAPADDEVLVEVRAASINEWDWGRVQGTPFANRAMFGLFKPKKHRILGCDISGCVEAVGTGVTRFRQGDEVFGDLSACGWGGFAEYVCAREDALAPKARTLTFEEAAAVPQAGLLALQALRKAGVERGKRVLFNGGGGGVGTFGIQIARCLGAEVTGVDSSEKLETMLAAGAHHVLDYAKEDFTHRGKAYDTIVDVVAARPPAHYRRSLRAGGMCVLVGGASSVIMRSMLVGWWGTRKVKLLLYKPNSADLAYMNELFEVGEVKPVVDRCYPLVEVPDAFRYYATGSAKGKVVVSMDRPP